MCFMIRASFDAAFVGLPLAMVAGTFVRSSYVAQGRGRDRFRVSRFRFTVGVRASTDHSATDATQEDRLGVEHREGPSNRELRGSHDRSRALQVAFQSCELSTHQTGLFVAAQSGVLTLFVRISSGSVSSLVSLPPLRTPRSSPSG